MISLECAVLDEQKRIMEIPCRDSSHDHQPTADVCITSSEKGTHENCLNISLTGYRSSSIAKREISIHLERNPSKRPLLMIRVPGNLFKDRTVQLTGLKFEDEEARQT